MPYFVNQVERYRLQFYGASSSGLSDLRAWLYLYGSGNTTGVVGTIGFYPPETLAHRQDAVDGLGRPQGNMSVNELVAVMDMLRMEKPVYVHWSENFRQVLLDTGPEPAGEEESSQP